MSAGRHYLVHFCEIILNLDEMSLKIFLICSSGDPFKKQKRTMCALLVEGITRNNFVDCF